MNKLLSSCCTLFLLSFLSCSGNGSDIDFREEMRSFVIALSRYARSIDSNFIIVPQNGHDLLTGNGGHDGTPVAEYIDAISGGGQEDFNYGYEGDGIATPAPEHAWMKGFLDILEANGKEVLVIDYCTGNTQIDDSYATNDAYNYITFATTDRELSTIPPYPAAPYEGDANNVLALSDARNFLYLITPGSFASKADYLTALRGPRHDLLVIDLFYGDTALTGAEVASLKTKSGGGTRLVLAYMSIGEAEDYRHYWQASWGPGYPLWLGTENPDWEGNYKVHYWEPEWQAIIYGNDSSYLKKILDAGFDGVYLDIIDAYEYYE
jgi:cysteinyl-tRNA synthetase, unknown class